MLGLLLLTYSRSILCLAFQLTGAYDDMHVDAMLISLRIHDLIARLLPLYSAKYRAFLPRILGWLRMRCALIKVTLAYAAAALMTLIRAIAVSRLQL